MIICIDISCFSIFLYIHTDRFLACRIAFVFVCSAFPFFFWLRMNHGSKCCIQPHPTLPVSTNFTYRDSLIAFLSGVAEMVAIANIPFASPSSQLFWLGRPCDKAFFPSLTWGTLLHQIVQLQDSLSDPCGAN